MDAAGDVAKWLSIFKEAVLMVIDGETGFCGILKRKVQCALKT